MEIKTKEINNEIVKPIKMPKEDKTPALVLK